jgi:hypothetical protein
MENRLLWRLGTCRTFCKMIGPVACPFMYGIKAIDPLPVPSITDPSASSTATLDAETASQSRREVIWHEAPVSATQWVSAPAGEFGEETLAFPAYSAVRSGSGTASMAWAAFA